IYRDFKWKIMKTPHFNIYYDHKMKRIAAKVARIAEKASARLSRQYQHELTKIIPIVLFNSAVDFMNNNITPQMIGEGTGGFTEFVRSRVVIPYTGRLDTLRHVVVHELSHAFQLDITFGSSLNTFLGQMAQRTPPLWIMEGLAEHFSVSNQSELTMYERDGIMSSTFPSLMQLNNIRSLGYRYFYIYRGGQSFFKWADQQYGSEKIALFYKKISKARDLETVFQNVFDKSITEINHLWFRDLKKKYWPHITNKQKAAFQHRQYSTHFKDFSSFNRHPVFSSHKRYLYFITDKNIYFKIVKYDTVQKKIVEVLAEAEKDTSIESLMIMNQSLSMNKDRNRLLFLTRKGDQFYFNIYNTHRNEIEKKIVNNFNSIYHIALSPEGERIAFSGMQQDQLDLYIYNIKQKKYFQVTDDDYAELEPAWSPDGNKIAYSCNKPFSCYSSKKNIYIYNIAKSNSGILSTSSGIDTSPAFSDDGRYIAFTSTRNGGPDIFVKKLKGEPYLYQITELIGGAGELSWSEDNSTIAFSGFNEGGYDIFTKSINLSNTNTVIRKTLEKYNNDTRELLQEIKIDNKYSCSGSAANTKSSNYSADMFPDMLFFMFGLQSASGLGGRLILSTSDMLNNYRLYMDTALSIKKLEYTNADNRQKTERLFNTDTDIQFVNMEKRLFHGLYTSIYQQNYFIWTEAYYSNLITYEQLPRIKIHDFLVGAMLQYPFSKYTRLDMRASTAYVGQTLQNASNDVRQKYNEFHKFALQSEVALTYDNTLPGLTHPLDNGRSKLLIKGAVPMGSDKVLSYLKAIGDYRQYFYSYKLRSSLAIRFMAGGVWGKDKNLHKFYLGGAHPDPSHPVLRGYSHYEFSGDKMHLLNLEYRFTFIREAQFAFPFKWNLRDLKMVLFLDLGSAYSDVKHYHFMSFKNGRMIFRDLKAGLGIGFRFIFFIFPVMVDFSTPWTGYSIKPLKQWQTDINIGFDF
ncbi:MAG TPA: hypothetical protein VKS21_09185, partial [Spirochaetota bacterium]|nr:hypothetical protein [Spirochaetota bacterium]